MRDRNGHTLRDQNGLALRDSYCFSLRKPRGPPPHLARYVCSFWARFSSLRASFFPSPRASFFRPCGAPSWAGLEAGLPPRQPRRLALHVHTLSTSKFETPTAAARVQPSSVLRTTPSHRRSRWGGLQMGRFFRYNRSCALRTAEEHNTAMLQGMEKRNPNSQPPGCCPANTSNATMYFNICLSLGHAVATLS